MFSGFRNNKTLYYLRAFFLDLLPVYLFKKDSEPLTELVDPEITTRVNYYNKLNELTSLPPEAIEIRNLKRPARGSVYYYDLKDLLRGFSRRFRILFHPGDVTFIPPFPAFVKSRPIHGNNANSVLLKLNKIRHYKFEPDPIDFNNKLDLLIGRAVVKVSHRIRFYEMYFNHPLCDLGQINTDRNPQWIKPKISIREHFCYKFILCLEGYDVATNLKWVMASNSLAVMPRPTYETWFMEGTLQGDFHYVEILPDYSNLEERLRYFINHPEEARKIIANANAFVATFRNDQNESLVSELVIWKYFRQTGQLGSGETTTRK